MAGFLYILDPSSRKFFCPECGKKRFVRFINKETKEYYPNEDMGRCDRQDNCGYFNKPNTSSGSESICFQTRKIKRHHNIPAPEPILFIPFDMFTKTRKCYEQNNFVKYLLTLAIPTIVNNRIVIYNIGTASKWKGATIFWQLDQNGKVRTGKKMLFHPPGHERQGKRIKEPKNYISFIHTNFKSKKGKYKQCLFGEHLLKLFPFHPVGLVESEKTAIICSIYYSEYIWLATGGKDGFTEEKCRTLKGRKVVVFPDLGSYEKWSEKAKKFTHITQFYVSSFMEFNATDEDKKNDPGMDLADFLERYPSDTFNPQLLIPNAFSRSSANGTNNEKLETPVPQESYQQLAVNHLTMKHPSVKVLFERLNLEVKKVSHIFPPEDRKAMVS